MTYSHLRAVVALGPLCFAGAVSAEQLHVQVDAAPIRWVAAKDQGSGFVDGLWFDADAAGADSGRIVRRSQGRSRLLATLGLPAEQRPAPTGVRLGWELLPATVTVERVELLEAPVAQSRTTGRLTYPNGTAEGRFTVLLRAGQMPGVLLVDLTFSWSKAPQRARLVEAGVELETVFDPRQIVTVLHPAKGADWGRQGAGFPVSPAGPTSGSLPYPTGGFRQRYSLWLREDAGFGRSIHYAGPEGKSFQHVAGDLELEWCGLGDGQRGVAVVMKGMSDAAPKMFGTLARNPRSLYAWAWPPMTDGLAVEKDKPYTLENLAFVLFGGSVTDTATVSAIESVRQALPPMGGNLRWPALDAPPLALPAPETAWLTAAPRNSGAELPAADPAPQANRIPIVLAGGESGDPAEPPVPFRFGVPFPAARLMSTDALRLIGGDGVEIPCQAVRTASWPDGSVKWALLDFMAAHPKPGADGPAVLLEWGEGVSARAVPSRPATAVTGADGAVTVDTGVLRFTAAPGPGGFLRTVDMDLNGDGRYDPDERIVDAPAAGERRAHFIYVHHDDASAYLSQSLDVPGVVEPAETTIESVVVESAGPLRATLRLDGRHRHRGVAAAGGDAGRGAPFTVWLTAHAGQSHIRVAHDFVVEGTGGRQQIAAIGLSIPLKLNAQRRRVLLEGSDPARPISAELRAGQELANVQERLDRARVLTFDRGEPGGGKRVLARGRSASEWLSVSDGRWGVAVGMKDMWELNPQAVHVGADGLSLWFWPPHVAPWDTRGMGPDVRGSSHERFRGVSRVHEAVLEFFSADRADPVSAGRRTRLFTRPAFARASATWICSTLAIGPCHPYDPERFPAAEALHRRSFLNARHEMILRPRLADTQPGIATYGSCGSTESYTQYALATSAARTGWPGQYRAALAKCRFDAGMAFRRGARPGNAANHPSDWANSTYRSVGDGGSRGAHIMFYLTGDEPLRVFADERARAFMDADSLAAWTREVQGRGLSRLFGHYGRSPWGHLLWAWERGGQGDYAEAVKKVFASAVEVARGGGLREKTDCGTGNAIGEIYAHCREPAILELARIIAADTAGKDVTLGGTAGILTLPALAFWETGDERYRNAVRAAVDRPVLGGAFSHWTMYAMMRMQMSLAALARHERGAETTNGDRP